jgi:hypothetical protein
MVLALIAGCGGGAGADPVTDGGEAEGAPAMCTVMLPASCPDPAPSFAADVAPIIANHCRKCHRPGGVEQNQPLTTYQQIFSRRGTVLNQIYRCKMPPAGEPPVPDTEVAVLLDWLICGAPDN